MCSRCGRNVLPQLPAIPNVAACSGWVFTPAMPTDAKGVAWLIGTCVRRDVHRLQRAQSLATVEQKRLAPRQRAPRIRLKSISHTGAAASALAIDARQQPDGL